MAGNIAAGLTIDYSQRLTFPHIQRELAETGVAIARAIIVEVRRTEPVPTKEIQS